MKRQKLKVKKGEYVPRGKVIGLLADIETPVVYYEIYAGVYVDGKEEKYYLIPQYFWDMKDIKNLERIFPTKMPLIGGKIEYSFYIGYILRLTQTVCLRCPKYNKLSIKETWARRETCLCK